MRQFYRVFPNLSTLWRELTWPHYIIRAGSILREMKEHGIIHVEYNKSEKSRGFYVTEAHRDEELATIIYQGGRNGQ